MPSSSISRATTRAPINSPGTIAKNEPPISQPARNAAEIAARISVAPLIDGTKYSISRPAPTVTSRTPSQGKLRPRIAHDQPNHSGGPSVISDGEPKVPDGGD